MSKHMGPELVTRPNKNAVKTLSGYFFQMPLRHNPVDNLVMAKQSPCLRMSSDTNERQRLTGRRDRNDNLPCLADCRNCTWRAEKSRSFVFLSML